MKGSQMDRVLQKLRDNALKFTPDIAVSSYKGISVKLPKFIHDAADSGHQARWLPFRLIPHRHRPRAELQPAHELQVDTLR